MAVVVYSVGILNPASIGGGQYTFDLFFEDGTKAKYLRVGDTVKANNGNEYSVDTWAGFSSDFSSGNQVTATFITTDVAPPADSGFNSTLFTPNAVNPLPILQTNGILGNIATFSGQNFEYQLEASWDDNVEANKAQVGDFIVDSNGKPFEVTFLDAGLFADPFRVREVDAVGEDPASGGATIFRPTANFNFYQGGALTDPARTNVFNRDKFFIDSNLGTGGSSNGDFQLISRTLNATEATNKQLILSPAPADPSEVSVFLIGGSAQKPGVDYDVVNGNELTWNGLGLDGFLAEGDMLLLLYFS